MASRFFEGPDSLEVLEDIVGSEWKITPAEDDSGVTFSIPTHGMHYEVDKWEPTVHRLIEKYGEEVPDVSTLGRRSEVAGEYVTWLEVSMEWPLPNDVVDMLNDISNTAVELFKKQA